MVLQKVEKAYSPIPLPQEHPNFLDKQQLENVLPFETQQQHQHWLGFSGIRNATSSTTLSLKENFFIMVEATVM